MRCVHSAHILATVVMIIMTIKSYKELISLETFEERFEYLKIGGSIGKFTFGIERYVNQALYSSSEWRQLRSKIIVRDDGCDLAVADRAIFDRVLIHHINPINLDDIEKGNDLVFDLNNLICTSHSTHNAIHYGNSSLLTLLPKERTKGDMCPWLIQE